MKATASLQFSVAVKNNESVSYTVLVDTAGMLPIDTWIKVENNRRTLNSGATETFLFTLTIPANAIEQDIPLPIKYLAIRNGNTQTVEGVVLTVIVDNSQPTESVCTLDYATSTKIKINYDGYDARSYWYTMQNTTTGYNGIKNFTVNLKNAAGTVIKNQPVNATEPRTFTFETLNANSTYYATVNATDIAGNSKTSSQLVVSTKPGPPTNITAVPSYCSLVISWDAMPGATNYSIGFVSDPSQNTTSNTNFTFSGLSPNTTYSFSLKSYGPEGWGDAVTKSFQTLPISYPSYTTSLKFCGTSQLIEVAPINAASSYTWSVPSPLTLDDGGQTTTTSTNSVTVNTNGASGTYPITVYASTICGTNSYSKTENLFVGNPVVVSNSPLAYYDGYTYNSVCNLQQKTTDMIIEGATSVIWSKNTSFPSNINWSQLGNNVTFYFYDINQTAVFSIYASNQCGTTSYEFGFKSIDCGGGGGCEVQYTISPNPASSSFRIIPNLPPPCEYSVINPDLNGSISIYDQSGTLKKKVKYDSSSEAEINVSELGNGSYILKISKDKKVTNKTLIIKH